MGSMNLVVGGDDHDVDDDDIGDDDDGECNCNALTILKVMTKMIATIGSSIDDDGGVDLI